MLALLFPEALATRASPWINALLETLTGGVALPEWPTREPRVLSSHARGPQLIAASWPSAAGSDL
jgi:hypothetical protein